MPCEYSASYRYDSSFNVCLCASSVVQAELETCKTSTIQRIEKTLQLEHTPIFTQNTDHLTSEKRKWLSFYINLRKNQSEFALNRRGLSEEEIHDIITSNVCLFNSVKKNEPADADNRSKSTILKISSRMPWRLWPMYGPISKLRTR